MTVSRLHSIANVFNLLLLVKLRLQEDYNQDPENSLILCAHAFFFFRDDPKPGLNLCSGLFSWLPSTPM